MRSVLILLLVSAGSFSQDLTPKTVWKTSYTTAFTYGVRVSRDGGTLALIGSPRGIPIEIRDLRTGRSRFIPIQGDCSSVPLSGNGRVVYLCQGAEDNEQVLHVIEKDGRDRVVYRKRRPYANLLHATADETRVLVSFSSPKGAELALIRLSDGSQEVLLSEAGLSVGRTTAALSDGDELLAFRRRIEGAPSRAETGLFVRLLATQ